MSQPEFDLERLGGPRGLRKVISAVLAAGEDALRWFDQHGRSVERKPDRSPVTEADRAVETRLRSFFASQYPDAGFLGEETGETAITAGGMRFIVDPIDGTRAFIRGIPTWSILVGLEAEGRPAVGIAFMPASGDLFVGVRGQGAECNGRPLRVSAVDELENAAVSHGALLQFAEAGAERVLRRLASDTYTQRGFADFDGYRQLLLGRVDAMVDPGVKPWDLCAAHVLVTEAGGRLTAFDGTESIYGGSAVATNGRIHDALVSLLLGA